MKKPKFILIIVFICSVPSLLMNAQENITTQCKKMRDFNSENDKNMLVVKQLMYDNFKHLFIGSHSQETKKKLINSFCSLSLSSPDYYVVYTCCDDELAGCIIFHKTSKKGAIIDKGVTVEKFRKKGIGLRQMEYAINVFKEMGIERVLFLTAEGNTGVYKIAERYGFVCDEKNFYFHGPYKRFVWKNS